MHSLKKWSAKVGLVVSAVTLVMGVAASTASATPVHVASPNYAGIVGSYFWDADGYTGELTINSVASNGAVSATLKQAGGANEYLNGSWSPNSGQLTINRPAASQTYWYALGGAPYNSHPTMFGGYYYQGNDTQHPYGTYLNSAPYVGGQVSRAAVRPNVASTITGQWAWNADGYGGLLNIISVASNGAVVATLTTNDTGVVENLTGSWDPQANKLLITRPIAGGPTQNYAYWYGNGNPFSTAMFGGYFLNSDNWVVTYGSSLG